MIGLRFVRVVSLGMYYVAKCRVAKDNGIVYYHAAYAYSTCETCRSVTFSQTTLILLYMITLSIIRDLKVSGQ